VGDPGVGKTAIAEGLARKIVPVKHPSLPIPTDLIRSDMGALLAATRSAATSRAPQGRRDRLESPKDAVLFIDGSTVHRCGQLPVGAWIVHLLKLRCRGQAAEQWGLRLTRIPPP